MNRQYFPYSKGVPLHRRIIILVMYYVSIVFFGRGYNFLMGRATSRMTNSVVVVASVDGSNFRFMLNDNYWNRLLVPRYRYESELEYCFSLMVDVPFTFFDCGANIGYWSVLLSSEAYGSKHVIAVEASSSTARQLSANLEINNNRFVVLNRAIYFEDGVHFTSTEAVHHAASEIVQAELGDSRAVESICIDSLVRDYATKSKDGLVIKLDVEGQEINAMRGAIETLQRNCLVVYEDHGKDVSHEVTRYVMEELGCAVFFIDDKCSVQAVTELMALDEIKKSKGIGYNFFACNMNSVFYTLMDAATSER